ncbi:S-adenosylmethionine:tRNA ribosyltransferase-isomerase [Methylocapsa sp. S129]|uniref:S-adenosylmethionine:tRNA ribosyltransferase-isomerase n=1 Tax=Methylocapsa sp. S129 TaxID=1641869 RepID=UPI00131E9075|nr:S-adenosylmethionine:tRNA ribosyltransferase-isomerase [Methylocapsa sp. S129]
MIAASAPVQRPPGAKLLHADKRGNIGRRARSEFASLVNPGDVVIANNAAVLPASLFGRHGPSGGRIEVRLAGRRSLQEIKQFFAVIFGEGDFRTRTEDRPKPPPIHPGDRLALGPLNTIVARVLNHPRYVALDFEGSPAEIWEGLARHGRPIQYAHIATPLALWDVWMAIAGPPVAFEAPSAGFALDWRMIESMTARGIRFGAITHAAGISSTGDAELDALLPFDEPYRIPRSTARIIAEARMRGGRVIAIGTSVVRALEHAGAMFDGDAPAGERLATQKIDSCSRLRVVDAILSGAHEQGSSHYELLRAFAGNETLSRIDAELEARDFRSHEFGDSVFIEKADDKAPVQAGASPYPPRESQPMVFAHDHPSIP